MVNTQLNNDLHKQTQRLDALTHALTDLSKISLDASEDLEKVYGKIARIVAKAIDVSRVGLWFYDEAKEYLICKGQFGVAESREAINYKIKRSDVPKYLKAVEGDRYLAVANVKDDEHTSELAKEYVETTKVRSMLDSAIRSMSGTMGVICCETVSQERIWTEAEKLFCASVADIVARIIQEFEQIRTYQKMLKQEATFKAVIEHISEGTMILDAKGRHKYVSPAMERMTGFCQEDLKGRELGFSMTKEEKKAAWDIIDEIIAGNGKKVYNLEREFPKKDGGKIHILSFIYNMMDVTGVNGIVIINRDVTELRIREEQLARSRKMEALGQLTGGLAHDFNNLLAIISGNSYLLSNFLTENERLLGLVNEIKYAALRGEEQISRLLSITKDSPDKIEKVSVENVVLNLEQILEKLLTREIDLELNLGRANLQVEIDVGALENTLINMVLNSKDAMPAGGTIQVETSSVTLSEPLKGAVIGVPAGKYVTISIQDNGIGMDEKTVERAMEPFFTTKGNNEGSGLGLSMAYRFLENAGGGLVLKSKLGEGTCFEVYLPCVGCDAMEEEKDEELTGKIVGNGEKVLAVDDEPALLRLLINVLEPAGYEVLVARNAQEAIDVLEEETDIKAVVSDVVMPGVLNGFDLALYVNEKRQGLPVILLSGYSERTLAQDKKYKNFAKCILAKPIDYEELVSRLGAELKRSSKA